MNATAQVQEIIQPYGGLTLHPAVTDADWKVWLNYWRNPRYAVPEKRVCSKCGAEMRLRPGKYGMFLGCSKYPRCKHTENHSSAG